MLWLLFNLPSVFVIRLYLKDLHSIGTWLTFLKNSFLSSTFTGSWYLMSSIFSAWAIYVLSKKLKTGATIAVTFIPFSLCALTSIYAGIMPKCIRGALLFFCFPLNIFNGVFYFALGKMLAENTNLIRKVISSRLIVLLVIVCYGFYVFEVIIGKRNGILSSTDVGFSLPILACLLVILCLKTCISIRNGILLRKLSTIIFCCQGNVLLCGSLRHYHLCSSIIYIIMLIGITIICFTVLFLQKHTKWNWIKYMT